MRWGPKLSKFQSSRRRRRAENERWRAASRAAVTISGNCLEAESGKWRALSELELEFEIDARLTTPKRPQAVR
jgi:hypothetical protein